MEGFTENENCVDDEYENDPINTEDLDNAELDSQPSENGAVTEDDEKETSDLTDTNISNEIPKPNGFTELSSSSATTDCHHSENLVKSTKRRIAVTTLNTFERKSEENVSTREEGSSMPLPQSAEKARPRRVAVKTLCTYARWEVDSKNNI